MANAKWILVANNLSVDDEAHLLTLCSAMKFTPDSTRQHKYWPVSGAEGAFNTPENLRTAWELHAWTSSIFILAQ